MFLLVLLLSLQSALDAVDAANERLVRCYFEVVRANLGADAASLESRLSGLCASQESTLRITGQRRLREMGRSAEQAKSEVDGLIRSVRSGLAAQSVRLQD